MHQSATHVIMIEPTNFYPNPETMSDNQFQSSQFQSGSPEATTLTTTQKALDEFNGLKNRLTEAGVKVSSYQDRRDEDNSPDSIFPNNWFSTHQSGELVLYPMKSNLRRTERRGDIINDLRKSHPTLLDLTRYEEQGTFLEGTGSFILDRTHRQAYCALSPRSDKELFNKWCEYMGYQPHTFSANDPTGSPVYHTNVIMAVGSHFVVVCLESINCQDERERLEATLKYTSKKVIDISWEQVTAFCGNVLELRGHNDQALLAMSDTAWRAFSAEQKATIEQYAKPVISAIPTIERLGGGGVRCMLAEIF